MKIIFYRDLPIKYSRVKLVARSLQHDEQMIYALGKADEREYGYIGKQAMPIMSPPADLWIIPVDIFLKTMPMMRWELFKDPTLV